MELKFAPGAKYFLGQQASQTCSKIIDDCISLSRNPWIAPDNASIIPFDAPPAVMHLFQDSFHWIIYYIEEFADKVVIANIGDKSEKPHLWRPEVI